MVTLQEIQTLKTKLSGVRDKTVQSKTLYDSTMARLMESLNKLIDLLAELDSNNQPSQFLERFNGRVFSTDEIIEDTGLRIKITSILDVDLLSEVTKYVNAVLSQMDESIEKEYKELLEQTEEWQKIIRGEQNATT